MGRHQPPRDYSAHSDIESSEPTTKEPVALPTDPRPPLPGPRPEESVRSTISPGFSAVPVTLSSERRRKGAGKAPGRASTPILGAAEGIPAEVEAHSGRRGDSAGGMNSPGNGTCACRTRYGGIPTKPGAPPTAHPPSTPSMMSSRITGAQTHRPGPRRFWPSAGPCREYRCRQLLRETKSNHRSDHP